MRLAIRLWRGEQVPLGTPAPVSPQQRRIRVFPRSSVRWQARAFTSEDGTERIGVIDSGVNIVIDNFQDFDTIDISTDRLIIWTSATTLPNLQGDTAQSADAPLEFYLEGNIVFRQVIGSSTPIACTTTCRKNVASCSTANC